jgi:hypothetical protein
MNSSDQSGCFAYFGVERKCPSIQVRLCALLGLSIGMDATVPTLKLPAIGRLGLDP